MVPDILRCVVERTPDGWQAICIDLDIAVQGATFDEAVASMEESIEVYLESVMALPEPDRLRLLNRRVPFFRRLRHAALYAFWELSPRRRPRARHDILTPGGACPA